MWSHRMTYFQQTFQTLMCSPWAPNLNICEVLIDSANRNTWRSGNLCAKTTITLAGERCISEFLTFKSDFRVQGPQGPPDLGWFPLWRQLLRARVFVPAPPSSVLLSGGRRPAWAHANAVTAGMLQLTRTRARLQTYCHQPVMSFGERTFYSVIVWKNEDDHYSCARHSIQPRCL